MNNLNFIEDIHVKNLDIYRRRFLTDTPGQNKQRSQAKCYALATLFCYHKRKKSIDNLVDHLIHFTHQIKKNAKKKQQKLDQEVGSRLGNINQLYRIVEIRGD